MVKHGQYFLLPSLEKIFHDILKVNFRLTGIIGMMKPIYKKKGDRIYKHAQEWKLKVTDKTKNKLNKFQICK